MERRRLIYFCCEDVAAHDSIRSLRADGWEIHTTSCTEQSVALIQQHHIPVGIIHFGHTQNAAHITRLERMMRLTTATVWLAITPQAQVDALIAQGLLPGYFYDYHTEPIDRLRLSHSLGHAHGMACVRHQLQPPRQQSAADMEMIAVSDSMQEVFRQIHKIASVDASVTICGESGTGKELAARAIHNQSARSQGPFIAINCGAIPPALIHSELFGHEKGSFTGAHRRKIGRLEAAHGGTIFLDEIADLPLDQQVNLLRFLQERSIVRVGGMDSVALDVRVLAASHIDLRQAVANGQFREDLFYRLNVIQLRIPALRERSEDIEPLAHYFFSVFARERNHNISGFSQQALLAMRNFSWPGNVRELINRIRRAIIMCEQTLITPQDLELAAAEDHNLVETLAQARIQAERQAISASLRLSRSNISEAARRLGVARMTLYRLMQKHQLDADEQKTVADYHDSQFALPLSFASKPGGSQ